MRKRMLMAGVLVVLAAGILLRLAPRRPAATDDGTQGGVPVAGPAPSAVARGPAGHEEPSHLADELNSPSGDIHQDLRIIDSVLGAYRSSIHGGNPVGENREVTAALTGRNRLGFAFIEPGNRAINAKGELCDRWGTPFFFHALSGDAMEIRSAGADRLLWTRDDEVLDPGGPAPHL